ncbi:4Fe-4S binding protein [Stappia sp. F7233]|uniref:4Fe-4S binding protein n=1 Tax=Stappia albiluteola TaxID=2758565 RepID=A0A839ADA5_9HYPH|nr:4Fe-4S dicluster domain-containing protein [Stappia albiluteola]MBA5776629.1 4Fe-4S binding protein [Stappia albiluteola]
MGMKRRRVLLCNCERTMALDPGRLGAFGEEPLHSHLCRTQLDAFEKAIRTGEPLLVACTQEAPLFSEVAGEQAPEADIAFANIRERAGWCASDTDPHPKIAALLAEAMLEPAPAPLRTVESDGLCLVYGAGQAAIDAARELEGRLSVTLVLSEAEDALLPAVADFPVFSGRLRSAAGSFGGFDVVVDGYAQLLPSSRRTPQFGLPRDGARARCSLILDLSEGTAPIAAPRKRDGYFRADPRDPAAVARAIFALSDMVGTFEKPFYVGYDADICAHGRSGKVGCSNCLDACPAGAITEDGDRIAVDAGICGGCGSCAAHCPTGAVFYQYPGRGDQIRRMQTLLASYREAGGKNPVLLLHEDPHGTEMISALARFGDGLPGNVLPLAMHAVTATGHEQMLAAILAGASRLIFLSPPQKADELVPLQAEIGIASALLAGMGHDTDGLFEILSESDPDRLDTACRAKARTAPVVQPSGFDPVGGKRDVARAAITALLERAKDAPDVIALPDDAPYGRIKIDGDGCTLCLACVGACPVNALSDNPDRPQVSLTETACVQCGLCAATCPEKVITLEARYNADDSALRPAVLHEEEPALCTRCGKPFGTQSSIRRISERLSGKHWMFQRPEQVALIGMCDDCRVAAQWEVGDNPMKVAGRPRITTTDDYLSAEKSGLSIDDFLKDN